MKIMFRALKSLIVLSFLLLDSFGAFEQLCPAVWCRPGSLCINTILFHTGYVLFNDANILH